MTDTLTTIREHIISMFLFDDRQLMVADDESLLENGIVDSTGVLDLIVFLEDQFNIKVGDEDVIPSNFDSVSRMASYVASKKADTRPRAVLAAD